MLQKETTDLTVHKQPKQIWTWSAIRANGNFSSDHSKNVEVMLSI